MSDIEKPCHFCGRSCVGQPRGKDPRGRYYHTACLEAQKAGAASASALPESGEADDLSIFEDDPGAQFELDVPAASFGADSAGPCAGCGHSMPAGTVICMNCGYNQSSGRALKSKVRRAKSVGGGGGGSALEVGRIAVAIISMVIGAVVIIGGILEFQELQDRGAGDSAYEIGLTIGLGIRSLFALLLLGGGGLTAARHALGFKLLRVWAIVQLTITLLCGLIPGILGIVAMLGSNRGELSDDQHALIGAAMLLLGLTLIWPIVILVWQSRAKHHLDTWR